MYKTLSDLNATGLVGVLTTNSDATILFPAMIITSIWIILALGSFYATTRRYSKGDFMASLTVGGFVASIIAGIMLIIPNFMPLRVLVITVILEILCFLLLISQDNMKNQ